MIAKTLVVLTLVAAMADPGPFAVVAPAVSVSERDRDTLARGEVVARIVPARDGQVAAFAATRVTAPPDALVAAARNIASLKKSQFVEAIGRFSDPPLLSDLDQLRLSERDRQVLSVCEVGACSFKLAAIEIDAIKRMRYGDKQGEKITDAVRQVLFERLTAYRSAGASAMPPIVNRRKPWQLGDVMTALHAQSPAVLRRPPLDGWISGRDEGELETFFYWSQEFYGTGKPVILLTHVAIHRPSRDAAIVVGKQVFASRYMNGAISMLAVTSDELGNHYLTYLNRTKVDLLGGVFGGIARTMLEAELADGLPDLISSLRRRLERSGHESSVDPLRHH